MQKWSVGQNNYWYTAFLFLEEAPWYIFALETTIQRVCDIIPPIPLPSIKMKLSEECNDGDEEYTTWKEWYGDVQQLFHSFVCCRVSEYCWRKTTSTSIALPYLYLRDTFPTRFQDIEDDDVDVTEEEKQEEKEELEKKWKLAVKTNEKFKQFQEKLSYKYVKDHYGDEE